MNSKTRSRKKTGILITLILAGEVIFFLPFVLARIFRPTLLLVFEISNFELGTYFSVYGIVAMVSYFFGGPMADRFPARNLISISLLLTGLGGFMLVMNPSGEMMKALYAFWGFTTIFLFWAALIKATREWGGDGFQGRAFGYLEGGRGLTAALIGTLSLLIFSRLMPENDLGNSIARIYSFQVVVMVTSAITILIGLMAYFIIPKNIVEDDVKNQFPKIKEVIAILSMPAVWMQGVIIICAYVGYKSTDDISLYANEVLGFDEVKSAGLGTAAVWMRPVFAVLAGFFADRFKGERVISWCFLLMIIGGLLIATGIFNSLTLITILILLSAVAGVYGIRGIYFAVMKESGIPLEATGLAVGIMSVVGYTPDVFMSPLMGFLLDTYPGEKGHQYVFLTLALFAFLGLLVSLLFKRVIQLNITDRD